MTIEFKIGGEYSSKRRNPSHLEEEGLGKSEWERRKASEILERQKQLLQGQTSITSDQAQGILDVLEDKLKYFSIARKEYDPSFINKLEELIGKLNAAQSRADHQLQIHRVKVNRYKQTGDKNVIGYFLIGKRKDYDFIEADKKTRYE